jgi:hypothetical protein
MISFIFKTKQKLNVIFINEEDKVDRMIDQSLKMVDWKNNMDKSLSLVDSSILAREEEY